MGASYVERRAVRVGVGFEWEIGHCGRWVFMMGGASDGGDGAAQKWRRPGSNGPRQCSCLTTVGRQVSYDKSYWNIILVTVIPAIPRAAMLFYFSACSVVWLRNNRGWRVTRGGSCVANSQSVLPPSSHHADEGICAIVITRSEKVFAGKRLALASCCIADAFAVIADGRSKKLVLISRTSHEMHAMRVL
jgi:hypothetical protein